MDDQTGAPAPEQQEFEQKFHDQQKRAENAEAKARALEEQLAQLQAQAPEPELPPQDNTDQFETLADHVGVLRGLNDDEVTELQTQAKDLGVDTIKFAKSPMWKAHLDTLRATKQAEAGTPDPSPRAAVYEGKTFADVVSDETTSAVTRQAAFEAQRDSILKRGRNQMI